jgi:photosystem II stability/assembly factor-like uncharacterized protein
MNKTLLFLGTRKGLVIYRKSKHKWNYSSTHFSGIPVTMTYVDPSNGTWWVCLDHGHWGIKLHRSKDQGQNWEDIEAPKYPETAEIKEGITATNKYIWAFTKTSNRLLVGTIPGGLFSSTDEGNSFTLNESLWNHPSRREHWFGGGFDYPGIHSIVVDPNDEAHFYIGISCAGVFETNDNGATWEVRNKGLRADFLPDPFTEVGHDPHLLVACPSQPEVMWQQNHCGIFRSTDAGKNWADISQKEGPANFGFTIAVHETDPDMAWVIPGISDVNRTPIDQSLVVCRTIDGGKRWEEQRSGLPQGDAFDIVYRHALDIDNDTLAFGTTTGNLFLSDNLGMEWRVISHYLPMVHSVDFV